MFQFPDPVKRRTALSKLGNAEDKVFLIFESSKINAKPVSDDIDRTNVHGKTSAVSFNNKMIIS